MTIEIDDNKNDMVGNSSSKKTKKVLRKKAIDIKHVARKLIMSWKQASEKQTITWKEIAPIIDSIDYLSSHWKNDNRLKKIEPVALEIVEKINKIHVELNLRVFGMNRLRIITDELLDVLKNNSQLNTPQSSNKEDFNNSNGSSSISVVNNDTTSQDKLKKLITALVHLSDLLKIEIDSSENTNLSVNQNHSHPKQKSKKRSIFYGLFGSSSSSSSQKQSNLNNSFSSTSTSNSHLDNINISSNTSSGQHINSTSNSLNHTSSTNSSSSTYDTNNNLNPTSSTSNLNSLSNSANSSTSNNACNDYRSNIVSEWQEYTRKYVEPSSLFKVCRCYLNAMPSAIPEKASILGQNWICIANEISVSLWNVLRKREDDLASSLIFLTLYKHSSMEIIERAINTIGSQLPDFQVIRLKVALSVIKETDLNKEQLLMLQSDYEDIINQKKINAASSSKLGVEINKHITNKKSQNLKKDKKNKNGKDKSNHHSDNEEPLSFEEMLAM